MDILSSKLRPHFPAFGDWDYYYYPHYYYTTSTTTSTGIIGNGYGDELQQHDLYGVEAADLYEGEEDHDQEQLKKPASFLPTSTTAVIVSPRKINSDTEGRLCKLYVEEEKMKEQESWVYESPKKYGNSHNSQATHDQYYHRAVDEDLYKIPTHHLHTKSKVKILGFISRCFKPTCVI